MKTITLTVNLYAMRLIFTKGILNCPVELIKQNQVVTNQYHYHRFISANNYEINTGTKSRKSDKDCRIAY